MGSSLMFKARKLDHEVKFIKPDWAYSYTEDDLKMREHKSIESGYWWIELGGDKEKIIDDAEDIHDELLRVIYGIWNHIKNTPGLDVYDAVMKKVNPTHSHSVGVSGSIGQKFVVRYNVVGSYLKEYGLSPYKIIPEG